MSSEHRGTPSSRPDRDAAPCDGSRSRPKELTLSTSPVGKCRPMPPVPPPPVVDAALALRRLLLRAADALLPPWAAVWDRTMGVAATERVGVPAPVGAAEERAGGPLTSGDHATPLRMDAQAPHPPDGRAA